MQSDFFKAICQMGIFMICAQSIVHFRPKAAYEKYLKMLVGAMVLIQIFLPVGRLLFGRDGAAFSESVRQFEENLEGSMDEASENADRSWQMLENMTLEEVRKRLEEEEAQRDGTRVQGGEENGEAPEEHMELSAEGDGMDPVYVEPVEEIRIETDSE